MMRGQGTLDSASEPETGGDAHGQPHRGSPRPEARAGNCYTGFPIDRLLSTGGQAELPGGHTYDMGEGERFMESPEVVGEAPSAVIGLFDISQRGKVDRELLSYTMPYRMFLEMESSVEESFLRTAAWRKLRERWPG
jgi:hypothetical protein